jgi:hypothetical protein
MMSPPFLIDLLILVADKDMEQTVVGICARSQALGVRTFSYRVLVHPGRDPGCVRDGVAFLRSFQQQYAFAMLLFDRIGSGREMQTRQQLEQDIERSLAESGWGERAAVVVLDPELEAWVWSDSPHVERVLGWQGHEPPLRQWLETQDYVMAAKPKPRHPKEAMEAALRSTRTPRSSSLYRQLAERVSLARCTDDAFIKFRSMLQVWFG